MVKRDGSGGATISVESQEQEGGWAFKVLITEADGSSSEHRVTLKEADRRRLAGGEVSPERLVEESFRFLLEREPKESILSRFDLPVISRYFPEYEAEITKRLR